MTDKIEIPERLIFYEGCTTSRMLKETRLATYVILERAVEKGIIKEYKTIPNERCCGYASMVMGDFENQKNCLLFNLNQMTRIGIKDVLFTCGACTHFMGDAPEFRKRGFRPVNIMEFIYALIENNDFDKLIDRKLPKGFKITGHYSCHLRRLSGLKMEELYKKISNALGAEYVEMPDATDCCGAGSEGTVAMEIAKKKVGNADGTEADVCPLACAGCEAILGIVSKQAKSRTKFSSLSTLIASCMTDLDKRIEKLNK